MGFSFSIFILSWNNCFGKFHVMKNLRHNPLISFVWLMVIYDN